MRSIRPVCFQGCSLHECGPAVKREPRWARLTILESWLNLFFRSHILRSFAMQALTRPCQNAVGSLRELATLKVNRTDRYNYVWRMPALQLTIPVSFKRRLTNSITTPKNGMPEFLFPASSTLPPVTKFQYTWAHFVTLLRTIQTNHFSL